MFKAAKQLTNLSKDFTIFIKKLENAKSLTEITELYEKTVEICSEMEEVSEKALLSAGIAAAEDRIETLIKTTVSALVSFIEAAESKEDALQEVLSSSDIFAEEILEGVENVF